MARLEAILGVAELRPQGLWRPAGAETAVAAGEHPMLGFHPSARVMMGERRATRHLLPRARQGAKTRGAPLALNPTVLFNR